MNHQDWQQCTFNTISNNAKQETLKKKKIVLKHLTQNIPN